ncbi:1-phosphofructokinase family hexose kinase [Atopobium fossor]|uniref:1-phosphofructokinase family hexose kinase n=1 Tax=Atopobium fossor TaxID=39487 RepID=UPI000423EEAF|nr:1-phosphofructokinase [Atopobium fossor]
MIYTLTTNPAVDMNITSDELRFDKVNRTRDAVYTPNGKGLNVSFTLAQYGVDSQILGFFGGFTGNYIVDGASKICPVKPVWIEGITRLNVFLTVGNKEYKQVNAGAPVSREAQLQMLDLIDSLKDLDCLVISGSLSPHMNPSYYDELIDVAQAKGAEFVLDISHPCLAHLVERKPLLIKPNDEEVADIFGVDVRSERDIINALHILHERGAKNILLTLGGEGAYFYDGQQVYHATAAKVDVLSTACAGDATLASFLSVWKDSRSEVKRALSRAMATGANVAMSAGLGDFALVDVLSKQIEVSQIK